MHAEFSFVESKHSSARQSCATECEEYDLVSGVRENMEKDKNKIKVLILKHISM